MPREEFSERRHHLVRPDRAIHFDTQSGSGEFLDDGEEFDPSPARQAIVNEIIRPNVVCMVGRTGNLPGCAGFLSWLSFGKAEAFLSPEPVHGFMVDFEALAVKDHMSSSVAVPFMPPGDGSKRGRDLLVLLRMGFIVKVRPVHSRKRATSPDRDSAFPKKLDSHPSLLRAYHFFD